MTLQTDPTRVMIVAGEASGDLHGANLIKAAREVSPGLSFFGVGGEAMRDAGCDVRVDSGQLSVMGVGEVLGRLPAIRRIYRELCGMLQEGSVDRPDLLLLVDFPGMNLRLAQAASKVAVPVLYYIAPKVWASREGRLKKMTRSIDRLAVIFPFEEELFTRAGIDTEYVGNPLLDEFSAWEGDSSLVERLGLDKEKPVLGLFPGSRGAEIRYCWPVLVEVARRLKEVRPQLQFIVPVAPGLDESSLKAQAASLPDLVFSRDNIYSVASSCSAALCVSGTVTLQVALTKTPMSVIYKTSPLTFALARRLVKIPHISLPNIVGGTEVVREFLQNEATPGVLVEEVLALIEDPRRRAGMIRNLEAVVDRLGEPGSSTRVARMCAGMVYRD